MSTLVRVATENGGGIAKANEDRRIAANAARLQKQRNRRLRAAILTIDRLLEELEILNLQRRSGSLSAWHRRLFSLGRLPNATRLDLTNEASPQHVMNVLFELQQRLTRELAGPEPDSLVENEMSSPGDRDGSSPRSDS